MSNVWKRWKQTFPPTIRNDSNECTLGDRPDVRTVRPSANLGPVTVTGESKQVCNTVIYIRNYKNFEKRQQILQKDQRHRENFIRLLIRSLISDCPLRPRSWTNLWMMNKFKRKRQWKRKQKRSRGTCARGAKCPRIGAFTCFVSVFAFVLIFICKLTHYPS